MAMVNMYHAPAGDQKALREHSEMRGFPRNGCNDNYAYATIQCNVAAVGNSSAAPGAAASDTTTLRQLGFFGTPCGHFDCNDCLAALTDMITNSRLPPGWTTGKFHIIGLGVYFDLANHVGSNFSGVWKHGGTGPFPPDATSAAPLWAYRLSFISYPPHLMYSGTCRYRLAQTTGNTAGDTSFYLTPEMQPPADSLPISAGATSASFIRDGHHCMAAQAHAEYIARSLYLVNRYHLAQAPSSLGISFNAEQFFKAFRFVDESGVSQPLSPWSDAPPLNGPEYDAYQVRFDHENKQWNDRIRQHGSIVPSKFAKFLPTPPGMLMFISLFMSYKLMLFFQAPRMVFDGVELPRLASVWKIGPPPKKRKQEASGAASASSKPKKRVRIAAAPTPAAAATAGRAPKNKGKKKSDLPKATVSAPSGSKSAAHERTLSTGFINQLLTGVSRLYFPLPCSHQSRIAHSRTIGPSG